MMEGVFTGATAMGKYTWMPGEIVTNWSWKGSPTVLQIIVIVMDGQLTAVIQVHKR